MDGEQKPNVVFQEEAQPRPALFVRQPSLLMRLVIRYSGGRVKDEKEAVRALGVIFAIIILLTILVAVFGGPSHVPVNPPSAL